MPTPNRMPALKTIMTEGNLARWLKNEGDPIKSGDVIAEIETDKATMEVEAVDEGTLGKILVQGGTEGVKVNQPIALLLEEGEDKSALEGAGAGGAPAAPPPAGGGGGQAPRGRGGGGARPPEARGYGAAGPVDPAVSPASGPEAQLVTPDAKPGRGNGQAGPAAPTAAPRGEGGPPL